MRTVRSILDKTNHKLIYTSFILDMGKFVLATSSSWWSDKEQHQSTLYDVDDDDRLGSNIFYSKEYDSHEEAFNYHRYLAGEEHDNLIVIFGL